ncbi:hypothetical protein [uncultured Friedmanniella sp.]
MEYQTPATEDRAIDVQGLLADRGHHRAPSVASLTGQVTERLSAA